MIHEEFKPFPKIGRLSREIIITEKIDGTNGVISVSEDGVLLLGSRSRWVAKVDQGELTWSSLDQKGRGLDNFSFGQWGFEHAEELTHGLGVGVHYGEWWGEGIQRGYGLRGKLFSLFNPRWRNNEMRPSCCEVVPTLYQGLFSEAAVHEAMVKLGSFGSKASPGFMRPEGVIVFHSGARVLFKKTFEKDDAGKGE